jgi:hypothetical protein
MSRGTLDSEVKGILTGLRRRLENYVLDDGEALAVPWLSVEQENEGYKAQIAIQRAEDALISLSERYEGTWKEDTIKLQIKELGRLTQIVREDDRVNWGRFNRLGLGPKRLGRQEWDNIYAKACEAVGKYFDAPGKKISRESIVHGLMSQGVGSKHALAIALQFEDALESASPVGVNSSNEAYFIRFRENGIEKAVKFTTNKKQTLNSLIINYHFSRHPVLKHHIAGVDTLKPASFEFGGKEIYMTVQERRPKSELPKTKGELMNYLHNWMRVIARVHVYGTVEMDRIGHYKQAQSFGVDKYKERIDTSIVDHDKSVLIDARNRGIEYGHTVIHVNPKDDNRLGGHTLSDCTLIDWDTSGRGNQFFDPVKITNEGLVAEILGRELNEAEKRELLGTLMEEKRACVGTLDPRIQEFYAWALEVNDDMDTTYHKFEMARAYMISHIEGQLYQKGDKRSDCENKTMELMRSQIPGVQSNLRTWIKGGKILVPVDFEAQEHKKELVPDKTVYHVEPAKADFVLDLVPAD